MIDRAVNGTARGVAAAGQRWRRWQSGNVQQYALSLLIGAVAVLAYFSWS